MEKQSLGNIVNSIAVTVCGASGGTGNTEGNTV